MKAVGLLSGGLDSTLAARLMLDQGIEVHAINFVTPFCQCTAKHASCSSVSKAVQQLGNIPLNQVALKDEYLQMIQHPKFGYGRGMNPCLDCRVMKIRQAGRYVKEIGASFLFTGEVLGQRPMSQHRAALEKIDKESGYADVTVRPLSARHLPVTLPEREGWLDRSKLLAISGRSRKEQIDLARMKSINDYPCPAGGCLLTDPHFASILRDYFQYTAQPGLADIPLLKTGRHFRLPNRDKIIVARDQAECERLEKLCLETDYLLIPVNFPGPTVLLRGNTVPAAIEKLLAFTKPIFVANPQVEIHHLNRREIIPVTDNLSVKST